MTCYYHHVPGRLRVRIPGLKGNTRLAAKVEESLRTCSGVEDISINPVTGSVVIRYNRDATHSRNILLYLTEKGFIDMEKAVPSGQYMNKSAEKMGETIGKAVFSACVEKVFENSAFSLLAALI
ncbi:MAG: cation transporter [Geobacteraceae bacterium]|nr:cation transporter [Geobacteraceae bacterium]